MKRLLVTLALIPMLTACGVEIIDTGNRGVQTEFGKAKDESLTEGMHFYNPLTSNIIEMNTKVSTIEFPIEAYTKDVQKATVKMAVSYHLSRDKAHVVFQEVGRGWEDVLLTPAFNGVAKDVVGKWNAVELVEGREEATKQIQEALTANLAAKNVTVTNVAITQLKYEQAFETAVEQKVVATQDAIKSQNVTVQIQEEAKQKVIAAEAEAKSLRIRSEALAQNKALVDYEAVQKWDGKLPQYIMGGGTVPFINLNPSK